MVNPSRGNHPPPFQSSFRLENLPPKSARMEPAVDRGIPYNEFIKSRARANPCIKDLAGHVKRPLASASAVVLLEYSAGDDAPPSPMKLTETHLPTLFQKVEASTSVSGRVLLVENIHAGLIELLGQYLDVDPVFFASHITTDFQGVEKAPPNPSLAFYPSQIAERGHLHIHYQQVVDLDCVHGPNDWTYLLQTNANVPRNTRRLPALSGRQLALTRGCCSILLKKLGPIWYSKHCPWDM